MCLVLGTLKLEVNQSFPHAILFNILIILKKSLAYHTFDLIRNFILTFFSMYTLFKLKIV